MNVLHGQVREQVKKKPKWTRLMIIDSQAVKNTCTASVTSKGFCFYKATNGIKRHLAVDTLGFPFFTHCTPANVSDDAGLIEMLTLNIDYFKSKPVNIAKITILLDHGYHIDALTEALEQVYPEIMTKIRFELSTKPSKQEKAAQGKSGFIPAVARWVIERSNAWMERCKSLVKNFECTLSHATTKINLCFIRLMLKRLAAAS
jgi:transposase